MHAVSVTCICACTVIAMPAPVNIPVMPSMCILHVVHLFVAITIKRNDNKTKNSSECEEFFGVYHHSFPNTGGAEVSLNTHRYMYHGWCSSFEAAAALEAYTRNLFNCYLYFNIACEGRFGNMVRSFRIRVKIL